MTPADNMIQQRDDRIFLLAPETPVYQAIAGELRSVLPEPLQWLEPASRQRLPRVGASARAFIVIVHAMPHVHLVGAVRDFLDSETPTATVGLYAPGSEAVAIQALDAGLDDAVELDPEGKWVQFVRAYHRRFLRRRSVTPARLQTTPSPVDNPAQDSDPDLFHQALAAVGDAVLLTDVEGVIRYVNRAFERMTGFKAAEAIGQNPRILRTELHDSGYYKQMWVAISSGQTWNGLMRNRRKNGETFDAELTISPVRDAQGRIIRYVGVQRDVTERRSGERELARLASVAMQNPNPIVELDFTGTLTYLNTEAETRFPGLVAQGLEHPILAGLWGLVHTLPADKAAEDHREVEYQQRTWVQRIKYLPDQSLVRIYAHDITDLRTAELQLRDEQDRRNQLFRFMMHDLNKPLAAITGYASRIRDAAQVPEVVRTRSGRILDAATRLQQIIERFLEVERIIKGEVHINLECFDFRGLLQDSIRMCSERFPRHRVVLHVSGSSPAVRVKPLYVASDPVYLGRIVSNLIDNAFKYSTGCLEISASCPTDSVVRLTVWNDGTPIHEEARRRIFQEFFLVGRADTDSDRHGLGLASCRLLAGFLGGRLWLEPPGPRGGTEFGLEVPTPTASRPFAPSQAQKPRRAS